MTTMRLLLLLLLLLAATLLAARTNNAPRPSAKPPAPVATVATIGYVEPVSEVRRLAFPGSGVVGEWFVKKGDFATKGTVLGRLKNEEQHASVVLAEAQEAVLEERLAFSRRNEARDKDLFERRTISAQQYDASQTAVAQTDAELKAARARTEVARQVLDNTLVRSPFDGIVLDILKDVGEPFSQLMPEAVLVFGDTRRLQVRAEVNENLIHRIAVGQPATVWRYAQPEVVSKGTVQEIKLVMGNKTVFSRRSDERKDVDILEVVINMSPEFRMPVGAQVEVAIDCNEK
ncbi:hypothetical protein DB346_16860 [Verrucomicrobia bacterium LW23]|nr:hypothetical protein DB346_16860 [Verrucomicrobia bacterium LW23]